MSLNGPKRPTVSPGFETKPTNSTVKDSHTSNDQVQACQLKGTAIFGKDISGYVTFKTISNGICPLKDGSTSAAMEYRFDLNTRTVTIRYCDKLDVTARLDNDEWTQWPSILSDLRSINPTDCDVFEVSHAEFFITLQRDGLSLSDVYCTKDKIYCDGQPTAKINRFFDASGRGKLQRFLLDLNRKHLPK